MTPADVEPAVAAHPRRRLGRPPGWFAFAVGHPRCRSFVAEADGEIVGTGVVTINGPVALDRHDLGRAGVARPRPGQGADRGTIDAAEAAGCRTLVLVATEPAAAVRDDSASRSRPGTGRWRRPGRGRHDARDRHRASVRSERTTCRRWPRSTARRPARTARICWPRSRRPTATRVVIGARRRDRAWLRRSAPRGAAARRSPPTSMTPWRILDARRDVPTPPTARPVPGSLAENGPGLDRARGRRLDGGLACPAARSAASRSAWEPEPRSGASSTTPWADQGPMGQPDTTRWWDGAGTQGRACCRHVVHPARPRAR